MLDAIQQKNLYKKHTPDFILLQHTFVQMHVNCPKSTTNATLANTALMTHIANKQTPPSGQTRFSFYLTINESRVCYCAKLGGSKISSTCAWPEFVCPSVWSFSGTGHGVTPHNTRYPGQTPVNTHTNSTNKPTQ